MIDLDFIARGIEWKTPQPLAVPVRVGDKEGVIDFECVVRTMLRDDSWIYVRLKDRLMATNKKNIHIMEGKRYENH